MRRLVVLLAVLGMAAEARAFPGVRLPQAGKGFFTPQTWLTRGLRWGRPELVGLIQRSALKVASRFGGSRLYVGDLSLKNGNRTQWHASHQDGCDADLIFYAMDDAGKPAQPPGQMVVYDPSGVGYAPGGARLRFDVKRNWALVKALIADPRTHVTRIFIANALRRRLLEHGQKVGDEPELLAQAGALMAQPSDSGAHDDHFHVRIIPSAATVARLDRKPAPARNARRPAMGSRAKHR